MFIYPKSKSILNSLLAEEGWVRVGRIAGHPIVHHAIRVCYRVAPERRRFNMKVSDYSVLRLKDRQ